MHLFPAVVFYIINLDKTVDIQFHDTYFVFQFSQLVFALGFYFLIIGITIFISDKLNVSKFAEKTKYRFFTSSFIISTIIYFTWFYLAYNKIDLSESKIGTDHFSQLVRRQNNISLASVYLIIILLTISILQAISYLTLLFRE